MNVYQKRHYEDVARVLCLFGERNPAIKTHILAGHFVILFANDNPDFDAKRFLRACGLEASK